MLPTLFIAAMTQMLVIMAKSSDTKFSASGLEAINIDRPVTDRDLHQGNGYGDREMKSDNDNIIYRLGGSVMNTGVIMYYIYYGQKWSLIEKLFLVQFGRTIGKSDWYGITRRYYDMNSSGKKNYVNCNVTVSSKAVHDKTYSLGKKFEGTVGSDIASIVKKYLDSGDLPIDENGIYTVFTDEDVQYKGYCENFCGFHHFMKYRKNAWSVNKKLKFQFIPKASTCKSCNPFLRANWASPHDLIAIEGMIKTFAHEITETVTNPLLNAWYDGRGKENADKCGRSYGDVTLQQIKPGKTVAYNTYFGFKRYLIQQNWDPDTQSCVSKSTLVGSC